jgi:DHA1 family tetracycline resistance protein-like MFS transporter
VLGGLLAPLGLRVPFFTTAAIGAAALIAVVLFVPESLPRGARAGGPAAPRPSARRVAPFLGVSLLSQTGRMSLESTIGFLVADRVAGDARAVGLLLGAVGLLAVALQGGGLRALTLRFSDRSLLAAGTALLALGLCALGFAASWPAIFGASALAAAGSAVATPTLLAELSRAAPAAQGEAQGLNSSALSLGRVLGPLLFTALYQTSPGALPYLVAGAVVSGALVCARGIPRGG